MTFLLQGIVKVSFLIALALVATAVLRGRSASMRHWILSVAITVSLFLPLMVPVTPAWNLVLMGFFETPQSQLSASSSDLVDTTTVMQATQSAPSSTRTGAAVALASPRLTLRVTVLLAWLWAVGTGISVLTLIVGLTRLRKLASSAREIVSGQWADLAAQITGTTGRRRVVLLQSSHPTLLVTWGLARPKVVLPAGAGDWTTARARIVLQHELAHVRRGDWGIQMAAEFLCAVYWFNPLVWLACRRLRQESEYACDDAVLSGGIDGADYAAHLLDLARTLKAERRTWLPAPAMARPSSLEGRISAMLNARINRSPLTRAARVATVVALLLVAVPIAGAQNAFSTFSGVVLDSTNRGVPEATLVLSNPTRQSKTEVRTDQTGRFEFIGLPAAEYALDIKKVGFSTLQDSVTIAGQGAVRTFTLQVGSLEETITVTPPGSASQKAVTRTPEQQEMRQHAQARRQTALDTCATAGAGAIGGNILPPVKLVDVRPVYPESLTGAKAGGVVTMDALIGPDGTVQDVRVVSAPNPDIDTAAVDAVRQWQFTPTLLNCTPIDVRMRVTTWFASQP